jgi:gas vesicle protein
MINNYDNKSSIAGGVGSNLLYFLIGGSIGATVALLFAPKPGKELRSDASEVVKHGIETANKTVSQLKETADDYYQKAQEKANEIYRVAFKAANDGTNEARAFSDKAFDTAQGVLKEAGPENAQQESSMFESGKRPFDQKDIKTGIL